MATARLKTSATPSRVPTTQDLALGEFGINTYDGALYFKRLDADGEAIVTVGLSRVPTGPVLLVIAGQSNAAGVYRATGSEFNPSSSKVRVWDGVGGVWGSSDLDQNPMARSNPNGNGSKNNYGVAMAHRVAEETGRNVFLVFDCVGGNSIDEWVASGVSSTRYAALKVKVEAALATTELASIDGVSAIVWAQGEEDFEDEYQTHYDNLELLDAQLRAEAWVGVAMQVYAMGPSNLHDRYAPEKALRDFSGQHFNWTFIPMNGLPTGFETGENSDFTHFLGESLWWGGFEGAAVPFLGLGGGFSQENRVLPFWGRSSGELTLDDVTAIASFDHLVSWGSRTKNSSAVTSHAATGSIAWGFDCVADGNYTFALGYECVTDNTANYTILAGRSLAATSAGDYCAGFGFQNELAATYSFAAGRGNTTTTSGSTALGLFSDGSSVAGSELAFRVGVGSSDGNRVNAIAVTEAGSVVAKQDFMVGADRVVGARRPAIADDSSGAANSATVNAVLAALRAHGLIEA